MLGSHKFITAGYFLVAGAGAYLAYQQSDFTLPPSAATAEVTSSIRAQHAEAAHDTMANDLPPALRLNQTLLAAQNALANSDALLDDMELSTLDTLDHNEAAHTTSWHTEKNQSRTPTFMLHDDVREYEVVSMDTTPSLPGEGEQVVVPLLNGTSVVVNVISSKVTRNGDYSWSGHVAGYGNDYPVIMTYGSKSAFAMITTPQGSYSMESIDGVGWLYKNPAEHELTAPGHEDFLEIPEQHQTHSDAAGGNTMDS